jgi:diguanylate cyclase (GGDEF)-like protein
VCSVFCGLRAFHIRGKAGTEQNKVLRLYLHYYFLISIGMLFFIYSDIKRGEISNTIYYLAVIFSTFPIFTFKEALFYIVVNTGGVFGILSCVGKNTFFENIQVIFIFVASWVVLFHLRATTYKILYNQCNQEELNRKLDSLSKIDPLTNLPNRRALDEYVQEKLPLWKQNKSKVMVLMIDIDNFKNYNDTFSHLDGDDCLNAVAGAVIEKLEDYKNRNYILSRIGGEEFMALLENWETEDEILDVCIQMKKSVEDMHLVAGNGSLHEFVTISIGCSVYDSLDIRAEGDNPVEAQYRFADYELYNAKKEGKNRVSYRGRIIGQLSEVS